MNEPLLTIIGNTTSPAELRFTSSGKAVVNFTVASTPRSLNKRSNQWEDGETMFVRCSAWESLAENIAETLTDKGTRVVVTGKLTVHSYQHEGTSRTSIQLDVDAIGPDLRYARAQVHKIARQPSGGSQDRPDGNEYAPPIGQGHTASAPPASGPASGSSSSGFDPWASGSRGVFDDLPKF